ncbi:MAG: ATP-binding protein [Desulfomonilaceae bacterium]
MNDKLLSMLVADDETLIRKKVRLMLGSAYYIEETDTAAGALSAIEKDYDVILLDIMFPDGSGIDVCHKIKERNKYCTVIISSSLESVEAWDRAFQAGADGYLEKRELLALDPRKIDIMIRNLVENNRLRQKTEEDGLRQKELLQVLSHDVRAPFQALLGTIDILRKKTIPDSVAHDVELLHECARDQLDFINSLLELLRLESGATGLRRMPMDLNLPVNQALQGLRMLADAKDIVIETRLASVLPAVNGDVGRICQLTANLLANAIKFTPRGGRVLISTRPVSHRGGPGVELTIDDTGIGISAEDRQKIYNRFYRGKQRGTEGEKGTGLGLAICKEIVNHHRGLLEILPIEPTGTSVRVWFPACAADGGTSSDNVQTICLQNARANCA